MAGSRGLGMRAGAYCYCSEAAPKLWFTTSEDRAQMKVIYTDVDGATQTLEFDDPYRRAQILRDDIAEGNLQLRRRDKGAGWKHMTRRCIFNSTAKLEAIRQSFPPVR